MRHLDTAYHFTPVRFVVTSLFLWRRPAQEGVQPVYRTGTHKSLGAHQPQSSKLKRAIMHKVFIVITSFVQSCAT